MFLALLPFAFLGYRVLVPGAAWPEAAAMAFDAAALVFLASLVPLLRHSDVTVMRARAERNDANRLLILGMTTLLTIVAMAAIGGELHGAREGQIVSIAKLTGTLLLIWLFANSVYALHYAHAYYTQVQGRDAKGLGFPGEETPYYAEFAYFAFTLAMTFQTSDVAITSRAIRRIVLFHCFAAFVFNIGVIAFTISVLAGG